MKSIKKSNIEEKLIYFYPKQVSFFLINLFNDLNLALKNSFLANIILIGSASRQELSIKLLGGNTVYYSDIEFIVIYPFFLSRKIKLNLYKVIKSYKKKVTEKKVFFDIDYGYYSYFKLLLSPNSIWKFELFANGLDLKKNLTSFIIKKSNVSTKNLSIDSVNDLIYIRLWHSLKFLRAKHSKEDLNFMLARNLLDVLTIFLPNKGVLLPSYQLRNDYIKNNNFIFSSDHIDLFNSAFRIKLNPFLASDIVIKLADYIEIYEVLFQQIRNKNKHHFFDIRYITKYTIKMLKILRLIHISKPIEFRNNLTTLLLNLHLFFHARKLTSSKQQYLKVEIIECHNKIFKNQVSNDIQNLEVLYSLIYDNLELLFLVILSNPSKERTKN